MNSTSRSLPHVKSPSPLGVRIIPNRPIIGLLLLKSSVYGIYVGESSSTSSLESSASRRYRLDICVKTGIGDHSALGDSHPTGILCSSSHDGCPSRLRLVGSHPRKRVGDGVVLGVLPRSLRSTSKGWLASSTARRESTAHIRLFLSTPSTVATHNGDIRGVSLVWFPWRTLWAGGRSIRCLRRRNCFFISVFIISIPSTSSFLPLRGHILIIGA